MEGRVLQGCLRHAPVKRINQDPLHRTFGIRPDRGQLIGVARTFLSTDKYDRRIELPLHPETLGLIGAGPHNHGRWVVPE